MFSKKAYEVERVVGLFFTGFAAVSFVFAVVLAVILYVISGEPLLGALGLIPLIFTFAFGVVGLPILIETQKKIEKKTRLMETGVVLWSQFESFDRDSLIRYNRKRPYFLTCAYYDPNTGKKHAFRSEGILYDPRTRWLPGTMLPVYVNPCDYGDYFVYVD